MNLHWGWLRITLEVSSVGSVVAALTAILPPIASLLGIIYWSIMIYKAWKSKDK